jgi:hypothetical protein
MTEFIYEAQLSVHAESEEEADRLARATCDFLNDPVLFGCAFVFDPGGGIAPPELRLAGEKPSSKEGPEGGAR